MNTAEVLVANGTSLLLLIVLIICRHMTRQDRRAADHVFTALIVLAVIGTVLELPAFLLDGHGGSLMRIGVVLFRSAEYACVATVSLLWLWYVDLTLDRDAVRTKTRFWPMTVGWAVLIGLLIANAFGGFLFRVDEHNAYVREPFGYVFCGFLLLSYAISVGLYYRFRASHGKAPLPPVWMFLTPQLLSVLVQLLFRGVSVFYLGCSVGLVGVYLHLQSKQGLVDGLTGLYNRASFEHAIFAARRNKRYVYGGIMLDVDRFKQINDTLGHPAGDSALVDAAKILRRAADRDSTAFRFAGDEFIVLVKAPADSPETLQEQIRAVEARILAEAEAVNADPGTPYKLSFSMGHAVFDTSRQGGDFFHGMDAEMYKNKHLHRSRPT